MRLSYTIVDDVSMCEPLDQVDRASATASAPAGKRSLPEESFAASHTTSATSDSFVFDSPDAALMVSLLPAMVHVRGIERLSALVRLVGDESTAQRSGRDLAPAIRQMHAHVARSWTVPQLAKIAALSRSTFFERFTRTVGLSPMEYLLAWRMAVARDLLRRRDHGIAEVAERVGYGSASTFSTAFSRHVGQPPGRYARAVELSAGQPQDAGAAGDNPPADGE